MKLTIALRRTTLFLSFAALMAVAGCITVESSTVADPDHRSIPVITNTSVADGGKLLIDGINGRVTVSRDPTLSKLEVSAEFHCGGATQAESNDRVKHTRLIAERTADGGIRVRAEFPALQSGAAHSPSDSANLDIRAARLDGIEIATTNGRIKVEGFAGQLKARTSNGGIRINGHSGPVLLQTSNGAIDARNIGTPAELETSNGTVDASLASGQDGPVSVRTSNGGVRLELPVSWSGHVEAETSNGRVNLEGGGRSKNIAVEKAHGTMDIDRAGKSKASILSSNGNVRVTALAATAQSAPTTTPPK
ncbi:MAG: hypothetical protein RIR77_1838 [Planctomycetota bacterium]|jgi:hypothetical protein